LRWGCQPEAEPLELLIVLQHLTLLQHLELTQCQLYYSDTYPDGFQPFSGLTASSHLTALILEEENSSLLPIEAFPYMFPAGRVLPHLEVLCLRRTRCFVPYYDGDTDEHADLYYDDLEPEQPFVEAEELELIAASCPALRQLALVDDAADQSFLNCQPLMQAAAQLPPAVTEIEGLGGWQRGSQDGHWMWPGFGELGMWLE
jgi:hypothetical protein